MPSGRGQVSQVATWGSHSAGMRKPRLAGVAESLMMGRSSDEAGPLEKGGCAKPCHCRRDGLLSGRQAADCHSKMLVVITGLIAGLAHVVSGPDHLAAVAPLAVREHRRSWRTGLRWGMGHSAGVGLVALMLFAIRESLPVEAISAWSERLVGVMLIGVGIWALRRGLKVEVHAHRHEHDGQASTSTCTSIRGTTGMRRGSDIRTRRSGSGRCTGWREAPIFSACCRRWHCRIGCRPWVTFQGSESVR